MTAAAAATAATQVTFQDPIESKSVLVHNCYSCCKLNPVIYIVFIVRLCTLPSDILNGLV